MDKVQLVYKFDGVDIPVSEAQRVVLDRLDKARVAVLNGATESVALVETTVLEDTWRAWYVSVSDAAKIRLLKRMRTLEKMIRNDLLRWRGNVPASNRSNMIH